MKQFDSWLLTRETLARRIFLLTHVVGVFPEQFTSVWVGCIVHLGPTCLFIVGVVSLMGKDGITMESILLCAGVVMSLTVVFILFLEWQDPAVKLPALSSQDFLHGILFVTGIGLFLGTLILYASYHSFLYIWSTTRTLEWLYICYGVLLNDFVYYCYHRFLTHGFPGSVFEHVHSPHHRIQVLDFCRGNLSSILDTAVLGFQIPLGWIAAVYHMSFDATLIVYVIILLLQATHHVNHTFSIGSLRFFLVDNHSHKLHHCPWGSNINFGACFSMWDRNLGTFYEDWKLNTSHVHQQRIELSVRPIKGFDFATCLSLFLIVMFFLLPVLFHPLKATIFILLCSTLLPLFLSVVSKSEG